MLINLNIIDLAVVKSLDLDINTGLTVLTGETGAGKSILLTALGLALGDRADSDYIRPGCKRAEINLEFDLTDAALAKQCLIDNELDNAGQCFIRRTINQDGRSKAYINSHPVTLQLLQTLSQQLVEIHGQHAHLQLLRNEQQRQLLDSYAKHHALLDKVSKTCQLWQQNYKQLASLKQVSKNQKESEEILRFQRQELEQLDLDNFNYQTLIEEHTRLANLDQILTIGQVQLDLLDENEQQSVNQMLGHAQTALSKLAELAPELNEVSNLLTEAQIQTAEATLQLRRFLEAQEADPQRMDWLENQLGIIHNLSRKHQINAEQLPMLYQQLSKELDSLNHSSETIDKLSVTVEQLLVEYHNLSSNLSKQRQLSATKLQQKITKTIGELGMSQGYFEIQVNKLENANPTSSGNDQIEFRISTNPGLPAKALNKAASGGELSRISLAIQVVTSNNKTVPTMIFDEVDSGIGGGIAEIVGKRLRTLSNNRQVLCVTHLPQIAAQCHHHLFVAKDKQTDMTASSITALDQTQRTQEIARMLGGVNITENTLAHAQEMLVLGTQVE